MTVDPGTLSTDALCLVTDSILSQMDQGKAASQQDAAKFLRERIRRVENSLKAYHRPYGGESAK